MKKKFSGKLWTILISSFIVCTGIVLACADGWGPEYGVSNFSPEAFVNKAYSPFFYSHMFYYEIGYEPDRDTRFNKNNTNDWFEFLGKQAKRSELKFLLEGAAAGSVDSAVNYINGRSSALPFSMRSFGLLNQKDNKKAIAFLTYLQLAKQAEVFALNNGQDQWDYDSKKEKPKNYDASALNEALLAEFTKTSDVFLKQRYLFQLERSYFLNLSPQKSIDLFNGNAKNMPRNTMYYRTLSYVAGAYASLKNFSVANYYYSLVYENCNELRTSSHFSFLPQEEKDWKATLAMCRNNDEKITLWQMLGTWHADEKRSIAEIYKLNPKSDKLDILLARIINKYEQKFNGGNQETLFAVESSDTSRVPIHQLVEKIAAAGNTAKPWAWYLAAGYLNTLDEKYTIANTWFSKAEPLVPANKLAQAQFRLLKIINTVAETKTIDDNLEARLLIDIDWLRTDTKKIPHLRYNDAFEWLKTTLAYKYKKQNELVKSECFSSKEVFYASNKNVEDLKAFLNKPEKTPYEQLCAGLAVKKMKDLFEYQAIQLAYKDDIDGAIEKMDKAGKGSAIVLAGNPFNGRILDCHECDHTAPQNIKYTKISFLKKIKEIKKKITAGEDVYNNAMLLANAFYNITHYGNARFFYGCKIIGDDHSSPYFIDTVFRFTLINMQIATKYYTISLKNTTTDEQKAKCQYMLAKCERNTWYNKHLYNKAEYSYTLNEMVDLNVLTGFKALKQYPNTQYYKDVIKECGYFLKYASR